MNEILDFVKAVSNPQRLRIIGLLSQKTATQAEIAVQLELSIKEVFGHITYLEQVGAITKSGEAYTLNDERLATLAREKLAQERPSFIPAQDLDDKSQKVLKTYLNADGSVKQIPSQPAKLDVVLNYLTTFFELNTNYTEKEVNIILRRFNEDTASLRRYLIDAGKLKREGDGSKYWKIK